MKIDSGYSLILTFENGERRKADLEDRLSGPIFEPLKNMAYFKQIVQQPFCKIASIV